MGGTNLENSDLRGAILRGADLDRSDLSGACLDRADLSGADLQGVTVDGAHLIGAIVSGTAADTPAWDAARASSCPWATRTELQPEPLTDQGRATTCLRSNTFREQTRDLSVDGVNH